MVLFPYLSNANHLKIVPPAFDVVSIISRTESLASNSFASARGLLEFRNFEHILDYLGCIDIPGIDVAA